MKRFKFISLPLLAVAMIFFTSYGGDANKTDTNTDSTGGGTDSPTVAASTIVTTPQGMLVVTHKVSNFEKWLAGYEANDSLRLANGIHSHVVGRGFEDSNTIRLSASVQAMFWHCRRYTTHGLDS